MSEELEFKIETGHTYEEYMEKFGDKYKSGDLWDVSEEDLESGAADLSPEIVYWEIEVEGQPHYFETCSEKESKIMKESIRRNILNENTPNFKESNIEGIPLLVFAFYDSVKNYYNKDAHKEAEEQGLELGTQEYEDFINDYIHRALEEYDLPLLSIDGVESLKNDLYDLEANIHNKADELEYEGDYDIDRIGALTHFKAKIQEGVWGDVQILAETDSYYKDCFSKEDIEEILKELNKIKEEYGLVEWIVASRGSDGSASYSIKESKNKFVKRPLKITHKIRESILNNTEEYLKALHKAYTELSKRKKGYAAIYGYTRKDNKKFSPFIPPILKDSHEDLVSFTRQFQSKPKGNVDITPDVLYKHNLEWVKDILKEHGLLKESNSFLETLGEEEENNSNFENIYNKKISFLIEDENEAIDGYDGAIKLFNDNQEIDSDTRELILSKLQHIKDEELEHIRELKDISNLFNGNKEEQTFEDTPEVETIEDETTTEVKDEVEVKEESLKEEKKKIFKVSMTSVSKKDETELGIKGIVVTYDVLANSEKEAKDWARKFDPGKRIVKVEEISEIGEDTIEQGSLNENSLSKRYHESKKKRKKKTTGIWLLGKGDPAENIKYFNHLTNVGSPMDSDIGIPGKEQSEIDYAIDSSNETDSSSDGDGSSDGGSVGENLEEFFGDVKNYLNTNKLAFALVDKNNTIFNERLSATQLKYLKKCLTEGQFNNMLLNNNRYNLQFMCDTKYKKFSDLPKNTTNKIIESLYKNNKACDKIEIE